MQKLAQDEQAFGFLKRLWVLAWQGIFKEKKLLPTLCFAYFTLIVVGMAIFTYLSYAGQLQKMLQVHRFIFSPDVLVTMLLLLFALNFALSVVIAHTYAWLHQQPDQPSRAWELAGKNAWKLFIIHCFILLSDIFLQFILQHITQNVPAFVSIFSSLLMFGLYLLLCSLPFVIYTPMVVAGESFLKAIAFGLHLFKKTWLFNITVIILGLFFPTMLIFLLLKIPGLQMLFSFLILLFYYPFLFQLIALMNVLLYDRAKNRYLVAMQSNGVDVKQA